MINQTPFSGNPKRDDIEKMGALYEDTDLSKVLEYASSKGYKTARIWQVENSGRNGCIEMTKSGARAGTVTSYELGSRIIYTLFGDKRDQNELKIHPLYTLSNKLEADGYKVEWLESKSEALKISKPQKPANGLADLLKIAVFGSEFKIVGVLWLNDEERNATRNDTWVFDYFEEDGTVEEILQKEAERRAIKIAPAQRLKQYCP